jgi:prevent-host-death family protein
MILKKLKSDVAKRSKQYILIPRRIKELKNKLTYYLGLTRKGDSIVVTDRGVPIAVLHNLDAVEDTASIGEKLAGLAKRGMIRLPLKKGKLTPFKPIKVKGKPASEIILEERR